MVVPGPIRVAFPQRRRLCVLDDRALPADLDRVVAGLDRAEAQIGDLHEQIQRWHGSNEITVRHRFSIDFLTHWWTVEIPEAPLTNWSFTVGEVLHQLRSSLDRTVYAAAQHVAGQRPPPDAKRLAFPVATSPEAFKDGAKRALRPFTVGGRGDVVDAIEAMQPYYDADGKILAADRASVEGLGLLSDLNNRDKHQEPHSVSFSAPASSAEYLTRSEKRSWTAVIGPVENGSEVGRVELASPDLPKIHFASGFVVAFLRMPLYGPSMLAALHAVATEAVHGLARVAWGDSWCST